MYSDIKDNVSRPPGLTRKLVESIMDGSINNLLRIFLIMKFLFCMIGLLLMVEGLPYFAFPDRMKRWMKMIQELPNHQLRVGLLIVYLSRR